MIESIFQFLFNIVITLVNVLLSPIDLLISTTMPDISNALDMVSDLFGFISNLIPWGMSWFGFNSVVIGLFVAYTTFELTAPLIVHTVKLAIKWYDKLKV